MLACMGFEANNIIKTLSLTNMTDIKQRRFSSELYKEYINNANKIKLTLDIQTTASSSSLPLTGIAKILKVGKLLFAVFTNPVY